jgi:hypothetical protein
MAVLEAAVFTLARAVRGLKAKGTQVAVTASGKVPAAVAVRAMPAT